MPPIGRCLGMTCPELGEPCRVGAFICASAWAGKRHDVDVTADDVDPLDRFSARVALLESQIPVPGAATAFMMSAATWTNQDDRPLSDPSGLWSLAVVAFLILGVGVMARADQVRQPPQHLWQRAPGLDRGFIEYYAVRGRTSPQVWLVVGRVVWILTGLALLAFVARDLTHSWA